MVKSIATKYFVITSWLLNKPIKAYKIKTY